MICLQAPKNKSQVLQFKKFKGLLLKTCIDIIFKFCYNKIVDLK